MNLRTERLVLRTPRDADVEALTAILEHPRVAAWWCGYDAARVRAELVREREDVTVLTIEREGRVIGAVQWYEQRDPDYRQAGIDLFLDFEEHGRSLGPEVIRAVVDHLFSACGHHRVVIDPARSNMAAVRAYEKVGFRTVGVLHRYERDENGAWRDGILMELVRSDVRTRGPRADVLVRDASDPAAILSMMAEFNRGERIDFDPTKSAPELEKLMGDRNLGRVLLFEVNGENAGYGIVTYGFDLEYGGRDAFITELFVVDRFRSHGIGRSTLERLLEIAKSDGAGAVHLQVRPENGAAIALYRSAGFETSLRMLMSRRF